MRLWQSATPALTVRLLVTSLALGVLHHADHVLRYDHSGCAFLAALGDARAGRR